MLPSSAKADGEPVTKAVSHWWAEHSRHLQSSGQRAAEPLGQQCWGAGPTQDRPGLQSSALSDTGAFSAASGETPRAAGECPPLEVLNKREDVAPEVTV